MIRLADIWNNNIDWQDRVRILISCGWTNADRSTLLSDFVFWTDRVHTLHYRASHLAQMPFSQFYDLVHNHDIFSAC